MVDERIAPPSAASYATRETELADIELNLLLDAIVRFSGHDYREFAPGMLKRRVADRQRAEGVATISALQDRVLHDRAALARFVRAMSAGPGRLFNDPAFFAAFRALVVPLLRTYSFTRLWVPGCAGGEDAYGLATVLHEEGLLERCMIYATDASDLAIANAKEGVFSIGSEQELKIAHHATGAVTSLSPLCEIHDGKVYFNETLQRSIIIAQHSVVSDATINEFHAIVARGLLPQFNKALQFKVHKLFLSSLVRLGFLCVGSNESLRMTPYERVFRQLPSGESIYRRMR